MHLGLVNITTSQSHGHFLSSLKAMLSLPTVLHRQFGNGVENPRIAAPARKLFLYRSWRITSWGQVMFNSKFRLCLWTSWQPFGGSEAPQKPWLGKKKKKLFTFTSLASFNLMVLVICYNFLLLNKSSVEIASNTIAFVRKAYTTYNDNNILEEATRKSFLSAKTACWCWITSETAFTVHFPP